MLPQTFEIGIQFEYRYLVPKEITMTEHKEDSLLVNWKCMIAVIIVSMSPFQVTLLTLQTALPETDCQTQYGLDYGLIGGIQAMVGFLRVRIDLIRRLILSNQQNDRSMAMRILASRWDGTSQPPSNNSSRL